MSSFPGRRVQKNAFTFPSRDGQTELHAISWVPEGEVRALFHICHGLNGHMELYDGFARFLAAKGFLVFGQDMLGHGLSAEYDEDLGYFAPLRGDDYVLADILMLSRTIRESYPEKPLFLLGQGMGSYFVRRYLFTWPDEAEGAVLMPTSGIRSWQAGLNQFFLALVSFFHKERFRPKHFMRKTAKFLNKRCAAHRSAYPWVCRNKTELEDKEKDAYTDFVPTLRLYADLNHSLRILAREEKLIDMPKNCPILLLYADEDPFSRGGEEPTRLAILYKQAGLEYVSLKGYSGSPLLWEKEDNKRQIEEDILSWLEASLYIQEKNSH